MDCFDFVIEDFDCDEGIFDIRIHYKVEYGEEYQLSIDMIEKWNEGPGWWLEWTEDAWNDQRQWFMEKIEEEYRKILGGRDE